jgi:DNA-binding NarL/FixJ family response regulator
MKTTETGDRGFPITILLAVGVRLYREGLSTMLAGAPDIQVVDTVENTVSAVAKAHNLNPDIVLLDTELNSSLSVVPGLLEVAPKTQIVALGVMETEAQIISYAAAGVAGYVTRSGSFEDLLSTIHNVARGELICSPRIAAALMKHIARPGTEIGNQVQRLTRREMEVIQFIDQGWSNKEIASRLNIEVSTVKNHVHHLLEKLGATRRGEAAASVRRVALAK